MNKAIAPSMLHPKSLLICFSHLRWDFVVQRPHHLLTRAATSYRVVYVEEPVFAAQDSASLDVRDEMSGVTIATPVLPQGIADPDSALRGLLDTLISATPHEALITWYYTPMALSFSAHLHPDACVYDCMDELAAFKGAPSELAGYEDLLFLRCDLVFTGGRSLYEAKRLRHADVHCFPSSIDAAHFYRARLLQNDPADQVDIPFPRIGYFGVIDERMDLDIVTRVAAALSDVQFVMLGPIAKIDPSTLPRAANIHWLGPKAYADLPVYLANWQSGWMPFALNEATRFISPTKTPEFLAAGLPVTSTAVTDVVDPYGKARLVRIADADTIVTSLRESLSGTDAGWQERVDALLAETSWNRTWAAMHRHLERKQNGTKGTGDPGALSSLQHRHGVRT